MKDCSPGSLNPIIGCTDARRHVETDIRPTASAVVTDLQSGSVRNFGYLSRVFLRPAVVRKRDQISPVYRRDSTVMFSSQYSGIRDYKSREVAQSPIYV